jgi:hypothetical protein
MKTRYFHYASLFLLLAASSACKKDFLSPRQVDLVYNEVFWSSENDAEKAVLGTYSLYRGLMVNGQMYDRGDVTTGIFKRGWNGGSPDALYIPGNFENVNGTQKSWGSLESYADWNGYYKVIAQANLVIAHLQSMPEKVFAQGHKESLLGEILFLRALTYYDIARIWGNAPLIYESIESSDQVINADKTLVNKARSSDVEIMDSVLSDAGKAVDLLAYGTPGSDTWGIRANKGSAQALAGSADLWMAFLKQRDGQDNTTYITDAVQKLEAVVQSGGYSLVSYSDPDAVHNMYKGQSSEAVFEINISSQQNETYRVDNGGIEFLTCKLVPLDGDESKDRASNINFVPFSQKQLIYPEYPTDIRAGLFFDAWDSPYEDAFSDVSQVSTDRHKVTWMTKFANFVVDPQRQWNEYVAYFAEANIPVFRFTGIKLLLAEAYVKNNEPGKALPIINEIRNRAGLSDYSGGDVLGEVLQQRASELIGEGKIFFDWVRNNRFPASSTMTPDRYAQQGYYWPVSSNILTTNKLVFQTPYWNGKTIW